MESYDIFGENAGLRYNFMLKYAENRQKDKNYYKKNKINAIIKELK